MAAPADPRRALLLRLLDASLAAVEGRARVRDALRGLPVRDTWVLAVGKAAASMAQGALDVLGPAVSRGLVVTRADCLDPALPDVGRLRCVVAGHPVPDRRSLAAGEEALAMARAAPRGQRVLLLVSGGASSLFEAPAPGVTLEALRCLNEWALASGLDIERLNAIRGALSRVKSGGLLRAFAHCDLRGYFVSDVPGDDPAVVGSGLLASRRADAPEEQALPDWLGALLAGVRRETAPVVEIPVQCVGSIGEALAAAAAAAGRAGLAVLPQASRLAGDAAAAAREACARVGEGPADAVHLLGGETTVVLPERPGRGGRNQHLALVAAQCIDGRDDVLVLACGTDGSDGNTADAGALVDGGTIDRGRDAGLDATRCLGLADSGRFLEAAGDLVHTGPTGTNVGDVLFALRREPRHSKGWRPSM